MIKKLQTLYKIDTKSKLREWTCVVDGSTFYAIKGLVGGKLTQDKPTQCVAKNVGRSNETTPEAQADFEAQAKFKKKLKSGYAETEEKAKVKKFYEPMLALSYDDRKDEAWNSKDEIYSQPKLDGIRCIVTKVDGKLIAKTRNGKVIDSIPHIIKSLEGFFKAFPDAVLDGELYNHEYRDNFNKITSLVRKQKPVRLDGESEEAFWKKEVKFRDALKESSEAIEYWIYDCPHLNDTINEKTAFNVRWLALQTHLFYVLTGKGCLVEVPTTLVPKTRELDACYNSYLEQGYEGQIVRVNKPYENKRSKFLLKRKEFIDAEYRVIDIEKGNGNRSGTAKHLVLWCDKNKVSFNSNIKGSFDYLAEIYNNRKTYIGKMATIKFFQLTPDGIPRFPYAIAFRDYE
jgi:DNA ligase-1